MILFLVKSGIWHETKVISGLRISDAILHYSSVEVFTLHYDRFEGHKFRSYDRNFKPHELEYDLPQWKGELKRPLNFEEMVRLVESMAVGFDFMRVDIYSVENKIYFSELTPYPGGTNTQFLPERQDVILGNKWK